MDSENIAGCDRIPAQIEGQPIAQGDMRQPKIVQDEIERQMLTEQLAQQMAKPSPDRLGMSCSSSEMSTREHLRRELRHSSDYHYGNSALFSWLLQALDHNPPTPIVQEHLIRLVGRVSRNGL